MALNIHYRGRRDLEVCYGQAKVVPLPYLVRRIPHVFGELEIG
jgi:hypothetical protein